MKSFKIFNTIQEVAEELQLVLDGRKAFILTDENVHSQCVNRVLQDLEYDGFEIIELEPGEDSKSLDICAQIWETLIECEAGRDSIMLNIGGGVITDIGGFAASVYKRGIEFIHLPTSLLAMTDAALGGKTGIDHLSIKNVVGSFVLPKDVIICPEFLETLPQRELLCGIAEMLKHGIVYDRQHWKRISDLSETDHMPLDCIKASAEIKLAVVNKDPHETGLRKILNFGHTIGHAIESASFSDTKPLLHGEAVALGMLVESELACRLNLLSAVERDEIHSGITRFFPPKKIKLPDFKSIENFLHQDKKNQGRKINFSLPVEIGKCEYNIQTEKKIIEAAYQSIQQKN